MFIRDLFGYEGRGFPTPDRWPELERLLLVSVPEDVGKLARKQFARIEYLSISQLRKPEWLALNLDNPFRDWDGRPTIRPAVAKGAFKAYVDARKQLLAATKGKPDLAAAEKTLKAFVLRLNELSTRSPLETMERDEVMRALYQLGECGGVPVRTIERWWEAWEDF